VRELILATGYQAELIQAFCGDGSKFGVKIDYVKEDLPLGTAGPLSLIRERFEADEYCLLMNGDILTRLDFGAFIELEPGLEGLVHVSEISDKRIRTPADAVKPGDEVRVRVLEIDRKLGSVTVSTQMAGRGTDIRLGGSDEADHDEVAELGGLHVIGTGRHHTERLDNQLRGRAGRQGDPGSAQAFISADDELIRRYLPSPLRQSLQKVLQKQLPAASTIARLAINVSQRKAQTLAGNQRRGVLRTDNWLDEALSFAGVEGL